jgi:hypothetical protein
MTMKTILKSLAAVSCTALLTTALHAAEPITILVSQIEVKGDLPATTGDVVTNQICTDLHKAVKEVKVFCPDDVKALLKVQEDLAAMGNSAEADNMAQKTIELTKAQKGIYGSVSKLGKSAILQLSLQDYKAGTTKRASVQVDTCEIAKLLNKVPDALIELFKEPDPKQQK